MDDKALAVLIFKAIRELGIDVPIMGIVLLKDERIQLSLYGGRVVEYPPASKHAENSDTAVASSDPDPAASKVTVAAEELVAIAAPRPAEVGSGLGSSIARRAAAVNRRAPASSGKKLRTVVPAPSDIASPEAAVVDGFSPPQGAPLSTTGLLDPDPVGLPAERDLPPLSSDIASFNHPAVRDLEAMETSTLQDLARRKGIKVTRKMNRDALIIALRGVK